MKVSSQYSLMWTISLQSDERNKRTDDKEQEDRLCVNFRDAFELNYPANCVLSV